jgi:DNA-directed RNA polymerase subunit RPC12/RpoP
MKEVRFECLKCGQVVETPAGMRGRGLACPGCGRWLVVPGARRYRPSILFVVVVGLFGLLGWGAWSGIREMNEASVRSVGKVETQWERSERMHLEAKQKLTNAVYEARPGVTRIVNVLLLDGGERPADWRATVAVDYQNERGGIQRTNVYLKFGSAMYGTVYCMEDSEKLFEIWKQSLSENR